MTPSFLSSLRRILPLAWPVFVGQVAVMAFATVDTFLLARYSSLDLAALAVGAAVYVSVFVGLMGIVMAVAPIAGQLFGAGKLEEAGDQLHQAAWLALALSLLGDVVLLFPEPFLWIAHAGPEVELRVRAYLRALALALPAALLFMAYRGFNQAVSRPKAVMLLQLGGLLFKIPLSAWLINGGAGVPELGSLGCGLATAIVMWAQAAIALLVLKRGGFYTQFGLHARGWHRPHWPALRHQLKLGIPMGASIMIEVTGFTFMAIFIARLGPTIVAGHELAVNLVAMMFMMPYAIGSATGTLVAQAVGAGEPLQARRTGWHGLLFALALSCGVGAAAFFGREAVLRVYTADMTLVAAALPLLLWVWIFHMGDAVQTVAAYVLRAHHIATAPMVIYALAIWGVGIGGGYHLAFGEGAPPMLRGAPGFWAAATAGLVLAALGLSAYLGWVHRQEAADAVRPSPAR
ncbi:MATE family efflux transporter [Pelomonas sp. KK5]|uniref:MATE family efflux transporter n=1 Tax=Pelomonas sp. KK5 TaxID=1855730 RepID=UPI00097C1A3D|nr:MATE family efflux transporter [Pelomonas sp. KK5]